MKIYTRQGDAGRTKLFGGLEVSKHDARVAAYGTFDELNASLGGVLSLDPNGVLGTADLQRVQEDLFILGSRLAAARPERELERGTIPGLAPGRIADLEAWIDSLDEELPPLDAFVLPGGCPAGAQLHVARTVCRRAEREVTALVDADPALSTAVIPYINRLSDLLFTLARAVNHRAGRPEARWLPQRERDTAALVPVDDAEDP
ncbi:MAG: cob(I)yrinic acid a,c-diamide adenosyltransferase [Gemmatimonadetes bacterium]|nr:cob(I)yrinic acid a,c-diamide adenosyltransferase [Gemmatimonadota bacterium]